MSKSKDDALAKRGETALATSAPSFVDAADRSGTDHITNDDMAMPRLALAQKMSPQLDAIDGLQFGDLFNSLTEEIYEQPLDFIVLRADPPRAIEFRPIEDGGGVVDPNVPLTDPRCRWGEDGEKPVATVFYDFIVALHPTRELIALSFKATGLKAAKALNALIKIRSGPVYGGLYEMTTQKKSGDKPYAVFNIRNSPRGPEKNPGWVPDEETYNWAKSVHEAIAFKEVKIDRDGHSADDGSVPAGHGQSEAATKDENVPF